MFTTYLDLCNQVLRRLNEVEIVEADFASVRGIHALVKDAVKSSVARLNQREFEWPFNAASHTQNLTAGTSEYAWPNFFKTVDWNSFQIQESSSLGVSYKSLKFIDRDVWYTSYRDIDYASGSSGRGIPDFVFPSHGSGFGLSPSPNAAYSVNFKYYLNFTDITAATDTTRIPEGFENVLVDGAVYHMYIFKDNTEAAQAAYATFDEGIKNLQTIYINSFSGITDTRLKF